MTTLNTSTRPMPCPPAKPILGHMTDFRGDMLGFLRRLAKDYNELVHLKLAHINVCYLFEAELVREVFVRRAKEFSKADINVHIFRKVFGNGLVISTGSFHAQQRKVMQPVFHHHRIQGYAPIITDYTAELMRGWRAGQMIDFHEEMMKLTMYIVGKALFDADMDSLEDEAQTVAEAIASNQKWLEKEFWLGFKVPFWLPTRGNRQMRRNNVALKEVLQPIVTAHRANPDQHKDLLTMLIAASEAERGEGGMSDEQLMDEVINLFSAGHETTSNALTFALYLLTRNTAVLRKLQAEVEGVLAGRAPTLDDLPALMYTEMVIKEAMRIYPPVWALQFREVRENTTLGGYQLKKGMIITAPIFGLHRNETYFPDPERFDPERFAPERAAGLPRYAYLPFGAGPHVCIGAQFAMMEAKLILAMLVQCFEFELADGYVFELEPQVTMSVRHGLPVRLVGR